MGVTGLPDNLSQVVLQIKLKRLPYKKQPIFLLNGEVILQASDSPCFNGSPSPRHYPLAGSDSVASLGDLSPFGRLLKPAATFFGTIFGTIIFKS